MKKLIPLFILLIGLAGYLGYYFGKRNQSSNIELKSFLNEYLKSENVIKPKWIPIGDNIARRMFDNYYAPLGHRNMIRNSMVTRPEFKEFKGDSTAIADVGTVLLFAAQAYLDGRKKMSLSFAQHDSISYPKKPGYNGYLTLIVSPLDDNNLPVNLSNDQNKYFDVMTLIPPDNP